MGREVRRVPADWRHPTNEDGNYIPLYPGEHYASRVAEWDEGAAQWAKGLRTDYQGGWKPVDDDQRGHSYEEWDGKRPEQADYMPDWPADRRTHYQMYEDTTEGTPISPPMPTPEALAQWLVDNKASAFGGQTASYDGWLAVCKGRWAPGLVLTISGDGTRTMLPGVELAAEEPETTAPQGEGAPHE